FLYDGGLVPQLHAVINFNDHPAMCAFLHQLGKLIVSDRRRICRLMDLGKSQGDGDLGERGAVKLEQREQTRQEKTCYVFHERHPHFVRCLFNRPRRSGRSVDHSFGERFWTSISASGALTYSI